jgi:putative oxidoreductase
MFCTKKNPFESSLGPNESLLRRSFVIDNTGLKLFTHNHFAVLLKRINIIDKISKFLLILLFAYTGSSKLLQHQVFLSQLTKIEMLKTIAVPVSFLLPALEIVTAIFLAIDRVQKIGVWLAAFLMTTFTMYIAGMLILKSSLLCTCGGVISSMTWKQHLLFNIFFMLLSWNALLHYYNPVNKIISTSKKEVS